MSLLVSRADYTVLFSCLLLLTTTYGRIDSAPAQLTFYPSSFKKKETRTAFKEKKETKRIFKQTSWWRALVQDLERVAKELQESDFVLE